MAVKICSICKKQYVATGHAQKMCPECKAEKKKWDGMKACAICGELFQAQRAQKYCDTCRTVTISKTRICQACGMEFEWQHPRDKYCTQCHADGTVKKIITEKQRVWHRNHYYAEHPIASRTEKRIQKKKQIFLSIDQILAIMKERNLHSYGETVKILEQEKGRTV